MRLTNAKTFVNFGVRDIGGGAVTQIDDIAVDCFKFSILWYFFSTCDGYEGVRNTTII